MKPSINQYFDMLYQWEKFSARCQLNLGMSFDVSFCHDMFAFLQ